MHINTKLVTKHDNKYKSALNLGILSFDYHPSTIYQKLKVEALFIFRPYGPIQTISTTELTTDHLPSFTYGETTPASLLNWNPTNLYGKPERSMAVRFQLSHS